MEMDDPNNPGQRARYHQALTFKELRGLKEAVVAYGALGKDSMLFGQGQYATIAAQINYDPAVYAQIGAAAVRAWKALPNKAAGDQLSKVQGSSESYSEFVSCLMQLAGKIFRDVDTAMPGLACGISNFFLFFLRTIELL
ncbi:hypothetical protein STEG23_016303 [Scotinomys teguina]